MTATDRIRSFAARIERLDAEISALNADKKEIYSEMKDDGFDVKAFKAAHRRHLAHTENPATAQEGEALTDIYFVALQGAEGAESQPAAKSGAANGLPEKPSRARARNTASGSSQCPEAVAAGEGAGDTTAAPAAPIHDPAPATPVPQGGAGQAGEADLNSVSPAAVDQSDMDIPAFLRRTPKVLEVA